MLSRENKIIAGFMIVPMLFVVLLGVAHPPTWVAAAVLLGWSNRSDIGQ
jgi:hypothetical protein